MQAGKESKREVKGTLVGKISVQPHTTLFMQFLDRENNDKTIDCHWENRFVVQ